MKRLLFILLLVVCCSNCFAYKLYIQVKVSSNSACMSFGGRDIEITPRYYSYLSVVNYLSENFGYSLVDSNIERNSAGQLVFYMWKEYKEGEPNYPKKQ